MFYDSSSADDFDDSDDDRGAAPAASAAAAASGSGSDSDGDDDFANPPPKAKAKAKAKSPAASKKRKAPAAAASAPAKGGKGKKRAAPSKSIAPLTEQRRRAAMDGVAALSAALYASNKGGAPAAAATVESLGVTGVREVRVLDAGQVSDGIEDIVAAVCASILSTGTFVLDVPQRTTANQLYVEALDRIVLKDTTAPRAFLSQTQARKAAITVRVLQLVHNVLQVRFFSRFSFSCRPPPCVNTPNRSPLPL